MDKGNSFMELAMKRVEEGRLSMEVVDEILMSYLCVSPLMNFSRYRKTEVGIEEF